MKKNTYLFIVFLICNYQPANAQCESSEQKLFKSPSALFSFSEASLSTSGSLIASGFASQNGAKTVVASFSNSNSTINWLKFYSVGSPYLSAVAANNDIFIAGYSLTDPGVTTLVIVRLDPSGNIKWTKRYKETFTPDNWLVSGIYPKEIIATSDDGVVICGNKGFQFPSSNNYKYRGFVLKLDNRGNIAWSRFDTNNAQEENYAVVEKSGHLFVGGCSSMGFVQYGTLTKLELATGNIVFTKGYQLGDVRASYVRDLHVTNYGFLCGMSSFKSSVAATGYYVLKINDNGDILAQKQLTFQAPNILNPYYEVKPTSDDGCLVWLNDNDNVLRLNEANLYKLDNQLNSQWQRSYPVPTSFPDAIIAKAWEENGTYKVIGVSTDPQLNNQLRFARLFSINPTGLLKGCITRDASLPVKDSLQFSVTNVTWANSYQLTFEAPFTTTISSSQGVPAETVICDNACQASDFFIEGDSLLCNTSETVIRVKRVGNCLPDFEWTINSSFADVFKLNDTTVRLQMKTTGSQLLSIKWITSCGIITKGVTITRNVLSKIPFLGSDTSLCRGDSLLLKLNNTWNYVQWFNNSSAAAVSVSNAGSYWVKVSDDNKCFLSDTLNIPTLYNKPNVNISSKENICLPGPLVLSPGNFSEYLWQDGSAASQYTVSATGIYWVVVTDMNGCTGGDTIEIKKIVNPPSSFLSFSDSAICTGQQTTLTLNNDFISYDWNNGASLQPKYTVNKPGIYTIKVVDGNGCEGRDTVILLDKFCQLGVFFPNAFAPGGINKTFHGIFPGIVPEEFLLTVYNRWGEKVFETKNPFGSWDGSFMGVKQQSDTYVWFCRYMFADKIVQQIRGTVILIR